MLRSRYDELFNMVEANVRVVKDEMLYAPNWDQIVLKLRAAAAAAEALAIEIKGVQQPKIGD